MKKQTEQKEAGERGRQGRMRPEHRGHSESRQEPDGQDLKKRELGCKWEQAKEETQRLRCPLDLGKKEGKVRKEEGNMRKTE